MRGLDRNRGGGMAFFLMLVVSLVGCAKVDSKPFTEFQQAVSTVGASMEDASATLVAKQREEMIAACAAARPVDVKREFYLVFGPEPYGATVEIPNYHAALVRMRAEFAGVNDALERYAEALLRLSEFEGMSDADQQVLSTELNGTLNRLSGRLFDAPGGGKVAIVSTLAVPAFNAYLLSRQRADLKSAIRGNQANVAAYADMAVGIIRVHLLQDIKTRYREEFRKIFSRFALADPEARRLEAERIVSLNESTLQALALHEALERTFRALPAAHADLALALDGRDVSLAGILEFWNRVSALQKRYEELKDAQ